MSDKSISECEREEALRVLKTWSVDGDENHKAFDLALTALKNMRRKGYKITLRQYPSAWICSECGKKHFDFGDNYCSDCGADVREVRN